MTSRELSPASLSLRQGLAALGRRYHQAGWLFGTSGNLSARADVDGTTRIVITASGRDKGTLDVGAFVEVDAEGALVAGGSGGRPSAETCIHTAIYAAFPAARAVLHVHTVASALVDTDGDAPPGITFRGLEMVKGWGLWEPDAAPRLPIFANHAHVPQIAADVAAHYAGSVHAQTPPAMVIRGHGITAWGQDLQSAHRHLEVTEYLCQVATARRA